MWPQTIECIRQVQPEFIFLENVPGLLVHDYSKQIFGEIAEAGYSFKWTVLGASDVGCLHHRKRLWIFGWKAKNPGRTLFFERKLWEACVNPMRTEWPTPKRQNANGPGIHGQGGMDLQTAVSMFPTPSANPPGYKNIELVDKNGNPPEHFNQRLYDKNTGRLVQKGLEQCVNMFPSPKSRDWKDGTSEGTQNRHSPDLGKVVGQSKVTGELNPDWVEFLMNWPMSWSNLEPLKEAVFLDPSIDPHPYPPRTTTVKENRANRIKALGNGQTPICAATAFRILSDGVLEIAKS